MAISARAAALREQRNRYASRKVLRPGSLKSTVNAIGRKMADAEFESMVSKYQDGLVGNQEMYNYLQSASESEYFTLKEKVDIENKLRDFKERATGDRLQAVFETSNGQDKVMAAQALVDFYEQRASEMAQGTPAQSNALSEVAKWQQKGIEITNQLAKDDRKINRAKQLFELSKLPPDELKTLEATAKVYQTLSQEAATDGEAAEAYDLASKANQVVSEQIPDLMDRKLKEALNTAFQDLRNQYHDGLISPLDAAAQAKKIDTTALEAGLYDMTSGINEFADSLQKDIEKGTVHGDINGLPFTIRNSGSEYTATVKQWKEKFALEDDTFNALKKEIDKDPVAASRLLSYINLYSAYMNGTNLKGEPVDEFMGMKARQEAFQTWQDNTEADYTNEIRDNQTKLNTLGDNLAKITYQYSNITGDEGNDVVSYVVQNVLPEASQFTPGTGAGNQGIIIRYDKFGNQREEPIVLNSQMQTTDELGNSLIENTFVGRDIAKTPDGRYVKLQPFYSTETAKSNNIPNFYFTVYNGQYWVKSLTNDALQPADQAAKEDTSSDKTIAFWYDSVSAQDAEMKEKWQKIQGQVQPNQPGAEIKAPLSPAEMAGMTRPLTQPWKPMSNADYFSGLGNQSLLPSGIQPEPIAEPKVPEIPKIDYVTPAAARVPAVGYGFAGFNSPANDINLSQYKNLQTVTPQANYIPPINITTSSTKSQLPAYQTPISNVGTQPTNNLQNAGLKIDLGNEYAPDIPQQTSNDNLLTGVKKAATGAWTWLKGLF